jgi:hypothetical protein
VILVTMVLLIPLIVFAGNSQISHQNIHGAPSSWNGWLIGCCID